jgi:mycothiol synthase
MDASWDLPAGYSLRPPRVDEAGAVNRLNAACDAAVGSPPSLTEDLIRQMWTRPRFVLDDDAWIVEQGRGLVGFAQIWEEAPARLSAFAIVHPEHTGLGIGTALATLIEGRAGERVDGEARLYSAALTQDAPASTLLEARGYTWARRFWHMEVELGGAPVPPAPPPGIRLRRLDPDRDLPAAHRILEEAFADHWDWVPTSYEEFVEISLHGDDFDPGLWIVAVDGDEPVGVLWGSAHTDRGWVGELGVLRSHRGRGIATALLLESFAEFERRGLPRARLNVDSDNLTGAVALYERVGMCVASSYDLWMLPIPAPAPRTADGA